MLHFDEMLNCRFTFREFRRVLCNKASKCDMLVVDDLFISLTYRVFVARLISE